jgi:hypothetical protein
MLDPRDPRLQELIRSEVLDALVTGVFDRLRFGLHIQGVEVTQAVQYYRASAHLTDPADRQPDNSVTLIAGKPAWVRVYVRAGFRRSAIANVTGTVEVFRRQHGFLYTSLGTLAAQPPGSVTAESAPAYATERGTLTSTLNFIVPADMMCGHLRLRVHVSAPGWEDETQVHLDVTLRQTLRLAGIMVGYNGPSSTAPNAPNLTLAAPTVADLQTTSAWTLLTFPVRSAATYRSAGTVTWSLPLTDAPSCSGCCTPNWVALNTAVQAQRTADGNRTDVLYYGLMANGIPMGPIVGCNTGGVSTGGNGAGVTMAHELGHACGLPHAPCGTPGDPNYPAYEPYDPAGTPQASIGEYGLDISNGNILSPAMFKDMMAYCGPRWISLYNYGRLTNNTNLDPVRACVDHPWWRDIVLYEPVLIPEKWLPDPPPDPAWRRRIVEPEPLVSVIGIVHADDRIEITSVMRLDAVRQVHGGIATDQVVELVGPEGRVLADAPVYRLQAHGQGGHGERGCGCKDEKGRTEGYYPYAFQAFVSDAAAGAALRIRRGEKDLWTRRAPDAEPRVGEVKARFKRGDRTGAVLEITWKARVSGDHEPEAWAQWSSDRGQTWCALATGLRGDAAVLDAAGLPSGRVLVRLLVSDGFHTVQTKAVAVTVPARPPAVSIMSPRDGQTLVAGQATRLWGAVSRGDGDMVETKGARWLVDGKEAATGLDAFITAPRAGEHRLTLSVTTKDGKAERTIKFTTVRVPEAR